MSTDVDERPPDVPPDDQLTMGIDPWEKNWIRFSVLLLVFFAILVTVAGFSAGFQLPGPESEVDPQEITTSGPFAEPGVREIADGRFEAYVIAQTWSFAPREIILPVGAEIDIYVTSPDLQHGFKITDTNVNMQIVPGQVSKLSFTFDEVGEYPYICTEYCGQAHAAMFGTVKVLSEVDYEAQAAGTTSDQTATDETAEAQG